MVLGWSEDLFNHIENPRIPCREPSYLLSLCQFARRKHKVFLHKPDMAPNWLSRLTQRENCKSTRVRASHCLLVSIHHGMMCLDFQGAEPHVHTPPNKV